MIYILFAAYNEEQIMPAFLANIRCEMERINAHYHVIACTDASTDNTSKIIEDAKSSMPIMLLEQSSKRGLGVAFKRALKAACDESKSDDDIAIFLDADCTHDLKYSEQLIKKINSGYDVVIASRFIKGSSVSGFPLHRMLLSYCASFFFRILFGIKNVRDYTCGYRAYKISVLKKAHDIYQENLITETDFCCLPELLIKLNELKINFSEIPFLYTYDAKIGESKMNIRRLIDRKSVV